MSQSLGTVQLCTDCMYAAEGLGDESVSPNAPVLRLIPAVYDLTSGMDWDEHYEPQACEAAYESGDPCGCDRIDFSWSACEGCGSTLGGERYVYTLWTE